MNNTKLINKGVIIYTSNGSQGFGKITGVIEKDEDVIVVVTTGDLETKYNLKAAIAKTLRFEDKEIQKEVADYYREPLLREKYNSCKRSLPSFQNLGVYQYSIDEGDKREIIKAENARIESSLDAYFESLIQNDDKLLDFDKIEDRIKDKNKELIEDTRAHIEDRIHEDAYRKLLDILNEYGFMGPVHVTEYQNFSSMLDDRHLYSRAKLEQMGRIFKDKAMGEAQSYADPWVVASVRFYYAFGTPTYNQAHYEEPVGLVFRKELIGWENAGFLPQSAAQINETPKENICQALHYFWGEIFKRGPFGTYDQILKSRIRKYRNTDFCICGDVPIENIEKIYVPNETIKEKVKLLICDKLDVPIDVDVDKFENAHRKW